MLVTAAELCVCCAFLCLVLESELVESGHGAQLGSVEEGPR